MKEYIRHILVSTICMLLAIGYNPSYAQKKKSINDVTKKDICIYGGTAAGVIAAVQAARLGKSVVIIEPSKYIGGMTSSGLGNTDVGKQATIGGVAREFYQSIHQWYENPAHWKYETKEKFLSKAKEGRISSDALFVFEPHVAELKLNEMITKEGIPVVYGERLDLKNGVTKKGTKIVSIRMESGRVFEAKVFIDCSYEGDLMANSGVSYTVGREPNSQYDEKINGVQTKEPKRKGERPLDPFIIPGDSTSGVIKGLMPNVVGNEGDGDKRVQAYNYRLCLTSQPENLVPFDKPQGYDESEYELLFRWLEAGNTKGLPLGSNPIPNEKTDTNKAGWVSTDYMGHADDYPDADYSKREKIVNDHYVYTKGLLWTLANHPRVPENVRFRASKIGYAKDEFTDTGHFPFQLYVREGRRMLGELIMTEHQLKGSKKVTDPVALGSYGMDSHPTQIWVDKEGALNADTPKWTGVPIYGISYKSITPKAEECSNIIVPICISASHSAYGSIRMEPVYIMLGQAAATAASLAIDKNVSIQEVPYDKLKTRLLVDGQILDAKASIK
ncbi:FAD-dependent oxidoreductase [Flavobacterium algicola]|uniref:FAD-dependent oxidoreductase n=1 Tax=Flavobacterium algicola TaxID=556529 RepID=UPI001EFD0AEE|nr:FAD-dependent oxidoreductase [Flavobacterium algicola]MCG9792853.1 FAD-dependent oxidoreductase [Flavobacterium algicola]